MNSLTSLNFSLKAGDNCLEHLGQDSSTISQGLLQVEQTAAVAKVSGSLHLSHSHRKK